MSPKSSSNEPRREKQLAEDFGALVEPVDEDGSQDGILGLAVEHEIVTPEQRRKIKARRRNTMMMALVLFSVGLVIMVSALAPKVDWFKKKDYSGDGNGTSVTFVVKSGATNTQIANSLEEMGVIADANRFLENYTKLNADKDLFIQPGEYNLEEEMSSDSALNILLALDRANQIYVAIAQNWRIDETFKAIVDTGAVSLADLNALNGDPSQFGIPDKFPSLEGWLRPGEYHFDKGTSAKDMIQTMVDRTKSDLAEVGVSGDEEIFHVLTVASILEFEGIPKDYAPIAGAIENRLNNPDGETAGYLQSDATVAYGLGKKSYHISTAEKQDASNKYNTFYYKGLPAGPIGSPALDAIKAAANPEKNDYYFWVTINLDTGETKYAKTYDEHLKNVAVYDKWCAANEGKCS